MGANLGERKRARLGERKRARLGERKRAKLGGVVSYVIREKGDKLGRIS